MRPSDLEHILAERGARFFGGDQSATVLTFGDVPAEYRAGRESALLLDVTQRDRVIATGADRADFLHRILANDVRGLAPGQGNANLLLSPKGKVVEAFELRVAADEIVLEAEEGRGGSLRSAVDMFLFSEKVALVEAGSTAAPLALCGPGARAIVETIVGLSAPTEVGHWAQGNGVCVVSAVVAGSSGWRIDAGPAGAAALWRRCEELGARAGGRIADDCLRAEAGQARFGVDIDDNVYPQEARLERAFSLTKGCYTGQEVVAKIDTYGGVNKRLVVVELDVDDPVARGTQLTQLDEDGAVRPLGLITTWAYSFERDHPIALAYVKRRYQALGTTFELAPGPGRATIVAMPVRPDGYAVTGEFV